MILYFLALCLLLCFRTAYFIRVAAIQWWMDQDKWWLQVHYSEARRTEVHRSITHEQLVATIAQLIVLDLFEYDITMKFKIYCSRCYRTVKNIASNADVALFPGENRSLKTRIPLCVTYLLSSVHQHRYLIWG